MNIHTWTSWIIVVPLLAGLQKFLCVSYTTNELESTLYVILSKGSLTKPHEEVEPLWRAKPICQSLPNMENRTFIDGTRLQETQQEIFHVMSRVSCQTFGQQNVISIKCLRLIDTFDERQQPHGWGHIYFHPVVSIHHLLLQKLT